MLIFYYFIIFNEEEGFVNGKLWYILQGNFYTSWTE